MQIMKKSLRYKPLENILKNSSKIYIDSLCSSLKSQLYRYYERSYSYKL
jgi:hypothetical protein